MELCFLINNASFHSSTAFSLVAETDGAEGKETERERGEVAAKSCLLHTTVSRLLYRPQSFTVLF